MTEELSIIVDENDEIIGYKPRREITSGDIYRVSALWIENSKGEVLLAERGFMKSNGPGKWGAAVAGTVEKGESYDDNIYKEAHEEIGISGIKFELGEKILSQSPGRNFFCQYYYLILDQDISDFILEEGEVASVRWFSEKEIKNIYKNNVELLGSRNFVEFKYGLSK